MTNNYKIVSYYTGQYEWDADQLKKSLTKLGIRNYDISEMVDSGSWERNTQHKSAYILEKMLQYKCPIVWTDADSRVRVEPKLFNNIEEDVGLYFISKEQVPEFTLPKDSLLTEESISKYGYLQSGTMFFNYTDRSLELLTKWLVMNSENTSQWDQWTLQLCLDEVNKLSIFTLPPEYVWIKGLSRNLYPNGNPVIEHLQASRKYKKR